MTQLENTTISVRSFALSMWAVIGVLFFVLTTGCYYWVNASRTLEEHGQKLDSIAAQVAGYQQQSTELQKEINENTEAEAALLKRMDDYRKFKWSVVMEQDQVEQEKQANPNWKAPDPVDTQQKILPYTP